MKASRFVCGSSLLLATWLGATFFNEVPFQRYPKLEKSPVTASLGESKARGIADTTGAMTLPSVTP